MKLHKWEDMLRKRYTPEQIAEMRESTRKELLEMDLKAIRDLVGKTQVEVAREIETTQSEISSMEKRADHRLSTLRRYVEALGGELEVIARFDDKTVRLRGV